ncbi:DUF1177 domain-containing protein [Fundicoccus culcitae]|uniref:DUF1177 domain-containing protein n=1 Tax=Fundicoccus culcitae TaxID=2969821 RepID=A0ABY5P4D0_9LACT|nr:DUF1177 domain-containing protein [Fundicoccus culcitae]UUX33404.1 DUF1177 domain-containing protein [Fundicoccus culcitae]
MSLKYAIEVYELMDDITINGQGIKTYLESISRNGDIHVETVYGEKGSTDFISIKIAGSNGKTKGGQAPTLGIVGRLGGIGARPEVIGFVSDGDGALSAIAIAAKLLSMSEKGDRLEGDVIVSTHICPTAPTQPHEPVPFMGSPVDILTMNQYEVSDEMDAVLTIDTTKGNYVINHRGFALTPTVKEGYILKMSNDILNISQQTTGKLPVTMPITMQDITPYGNGLFHINSLMQPAVATNAPVIGVAITTEVAVAGSASGATHLVDVEEVIRFGIEVAKRFTADTCDFYDAEEFDLIQSLYGSMKHLQTPGKVAEEA